MALDPVTQVSGRGVFVPGADIDTDRIIPARFMKCVTFDGLGEFAFYDVRFNSETGEKTEHPLNDPRFEGASILVAGVNFGCGSSREHAPWSIQGYGFQVLIAPSFADIFRSNCMKVGLVPIELPEETVRALMDAVDKENGSEVSVDLEAKTIVGPDGSVIPFEFDEFRRHCLLNGLDDIALTLQHQGDISAYEAANPSRIDTLALSGSN